MTAQNYEYDLFVSYARGDNTGSTTAPAGFVAAAVEKIQADQLRLGNEDVRIFFDTFAVRDYDNWRFRIQRHLRSSSAILICLSPSYFEGSHCRWEWREFEEQQQELRAAGMPLKPIYFLEIPGSDEHDNATRLQAQAGSLAAQIRPLSRTTLLARSSGLSVVNTTSIELLFDEHSQSSHLAPSLVSKLHQMSTDLPGSAEAMQFASLLPNEHIPWLWLKELVGSHFDGKGEKINDFAAIKVAVQQLRLMITTDVPQVGRMHHLAADHFAGTMTVDTRQAFQRQIHKLILSRLEHFKSEEKRLIQEVLRGEHATGAADWYVPPLEEVYPRAMSSDFVDIRVLADNSFVLTLKPGITWEEPCFRAFVRQQFLSNDPEAVDWALRTKMIPEEDLLQFVEKMEQLEAKQPEGLHEVTILARFWLNLAGARCRQGFNQSPYYLAAEAEKWLEKLQARHPGNEEVAALLKEAQQARWMYDW